MFCFRSASRAPRLLKNGFPLGIFCVLHADDTKFVFGVPDALRTWTTTSTSASNAKPNELLIAMAVNNVTSIYKLFKLFAMLINVRSGPPFYRPRSWWFCGNAVWSIGAGIEWNMKDIQCMKQDINNIIQKWSYTSEAALNVFALGTRECREGGERITDWLTTADLTSGCHIPSLLSC